MIDAPLEIIVAVAAGALFALTLLIGLWRTLSSIRGIDRRLDELDHLEERIDHTESLLKEEIAASRRELIDASAANRRETAETLRNVAESMTHRLSEMSLMQKNLNDGFSTQIRTLIEANDRRLTEIRATVDEKLSDTLGKRLDASYERVAKQLERVSQGLGEMRTLASGVSDLKRALTNVKTRGVWGEVQLESILSDILTPDQYEANVATKENSRERVEFAVRLPGGDDDQPVWLPIDAKFPLESYQKILVARDGADKEALLAAQKQLEGQVKAEAKKIAEKYLNPPVTTDFAVMFLPSEGLYAEVMSRPGLIDTLQHDHRITISGPVTLSALLNSLQMGFTTLAIQERASEVWRLLGAVKTEFTKYGDAVASTKRKLEEAVGTIDQVEVRTRAVERKLKNIEHGEVLGE